MLIVIMVGSIYVIVVFGLTFLFSMVSLVGWGNNYGFGGGWSSECGFVPVNNTSFISRFTFWLIMVHFSLFEQEMVVALLYAFGFSAFGGVRWMGRFPVSLPPDPLTEGSK
jgi:NADH:ubiquinone oxidoreductase subunit 3 (subunit A)